MKDRTTRREASVWDWALMVALGVALFVYGSVSGRTGLPPQPETVAGPIFDQVAGLAVATFGLGGLAAVFTRARARRHAPSRRASPRTPVAARHPRRTARDRSGWPERTRPVGSVRRRHPAPPTVRRPG